MPATTSGRAATSGRAITSGRRAERPTNDALYDSLRDAITRREFPPGARLPETELAVRFGVSRAQIREVFALLEERGLIARIPNRGARVIRLSHPEIIELFDVREVLEGLCVRLATRNLPPDSWQDLVDLFDGPMERDVRERDFDAYLAKLSLFRRRTIDAAGSALLSDMLDRIHDRTRIFIYRMVLLPGRAEQGLEEHRRTLAAMRRADADEAEALKRENIRSARAMFERYAAHLT